MTSDNLTSWSSAISSRLSGSVGRNAADREAWQQIIAAGEDELVLDALERDAKVLVAFCRAWGDAVREAWEAEENANMETEDVTA